jgi:hypothetical protein
VNSQIAGAQRWHAACSSWGMAGRESRAKRLLPSFIAVAGMLACGQTEGGPELSVNPPAPPGSTGGSAGNAGNVGHVFTPGGCSASGPGGSGCTGGYTGGSAGYTGGSGGYTGGTAGVNGMGGTAGNPPCTLLACPDSLPDSGTSCAPQVGEPFVFCWFRPVCVYETPRCGSVGAQCDLQTWQVDSCGAGGAPGDGGGGAPTEGGAFSDAGSPANAGSPGEAT